MIFIHKYYKTNAFVMAQIACVALTMVNVAYSDFVKKLKNKNGLRTLTRSIFAHTRNRAGFTNHSLVRLSSVFCKNGLGTATR